MHAERLIPGDGITLELYIKVIPDKESRQSGMTDGKKETGQYGTETVIVNLDKQKQMLAHAL